LLKTVSFQAHDHLFRFILLFTGAFAGAVFSTAGFGATVGIAKSAGTLAEENMKRMGITWVSFEGKRFPYRSEQPGVHYKLIVDATWAKVRQNPEVKKVLLSTGDLILKPDHHGEPNAPPEWRYYEIWMQIRKDLNAGKQAR